MKVAPEGRYEDEVQAIHTEADAAVTILMILEGNKGTGFSVAVSPDKIRWPIEDHPTNVAHILRGIADELDKSEPMLPRIKPKKE